MSCCQDKNGTCHDLIIEWITTHEQIVKLEEFAKSCEHEFYFAPAIHRIFVVKKKITGEWLGWVKIPISPLLQVSWHRDHASPRDVMEGVRMIGGWAKIQFGEVILAVPDESETFTYETMQKLGAYPIHSSLYIADGLL